MRFLLVLFIVLSACILLGGLCMLAAGVKAADAMICIAIGCLLFFGAGAYMASHPGHRLAKGLVIGLVALIVGGLLLTVLVAITYSLLFRPFADMEHYLRVWENPVTVSAVVTDHNSYDDDGDTDYRSYITYIYDDVRYIDFPYEDRDKEADLTPLGTEVTVQISPLNPKQQISQLKRSGSRVPFTSILLFASLAGIYILIQKSFRPKHTRGIPDTETIRKDIQAKIRRRFLRPFLLLCWVGYSFLYWRYSISLSQTPLFLAGISGAGWLYCMFATIRDYRCAENDDFELHRDLLVDKQEYEDDGSYTYWLCYQRGDRTWKTKVKADVFSRAKIGDSVVAVYLPGRKKPIVHYDSDGMSH